MKNCLKAEKLQKSYGKKQVVDNISLYVRKGEIVGLLGPNGAGKTTTFSIILGLIPTNSGKFLLNGEDITNLPMYMRARKGLCLLPQEPSAFRKLSVEDNLLSIIDFHFGKRIYLVGWFQSTKHRKHSSYLKCVRCNVGIEIRLI